MSTLLIRQQRFQLGGSLLLNGATGPSTAAEEVSLRARTGKDRLANRRTAMDGK
jgi:hypothetical protein